MILEGERLDTLVRECNKLIEDKEYKSPECYTILSYMIQQLIKISGYHKNPMETLERLELDAILRCYTKIPRFSLDKANAARAKNGLKPDYGRSIHRYVQTIILTSFLTTFAQVLSKRMHYVAIDALGVKMSHKSGDDDSIELAFIEKEDVEAVIDAATVAERARVFEEKLDKIEKLMKKGR